MNSEKEKSFEEDLEELSGIVAKLETGQTPLDEAIDEFQKAIKLAKNCDDKLKKAEEAIHKIVDDNNDVKDFQIEE